MWISVKDSVPSLKDSGFSRSVLVTDAGGLMAVGWINGIDGDADFWVTDNGQIGIAIDEVVFWCELPAPPVGIPSHV